MGRRTENRRLLEQLLPALPTQKFRYPENAAVVLGKAFALDDDHFVAYPDSAFASIEQAVLHLFELLASGEELLLPSFLVDLSEQTPRVRRLRYCANEIRVGQTAADTLALHTLTLERLRSLVGDLPPACSPLFAPA